MNRILDRVWDCLSAGAHAGRARSPYTMLQAATIALDGAPFVRTASAAR
ncbi:MAG: hypothetical protein GAK40_00699 [Burkholderia plantarii]|nr:MAG: hypothetical protein GAK40_00699 [Burkholderia plantarii]